MAPAVQIIVSALLFSFGIVGPESVFAETRESGLSASILSITALLLGSVMLASFVMSRILSWYIRR
jgi:uncharacterized membrane protein